MKLIKLSILILTMVSSFVFALPGDEQLTGDTKTACEVILCLSSSTRPPECSAPISKYFSIKIYHHGSFSPNRTIKARKNFLNLCPVSNQNNKMSSLVDAMSNQLDENLCKARELNRTIDKAHGKYRTTATLPVYCNALFNHEYTNLKRPKYTCNKEFYDAKDWRRGYTITKKWFREIKKPIKKTCWID
ncbi:hypothetical protein A9G45_01425 [Gilliamella sp. HK2]|jgi:hypothetical protein|uniref:TrbM/KikA/MpfK family conjugal transfer protein n=1 Tax=unclassified Gilliamella TaxID=2685620 RepID=UPI00080E6A70|nr:TrbM/KikA/MpfK family conjugal transfer protein [Gilliamella apicola]OCG28979.1 hypothetical protein A9G46_01680 [Gilliamella apicola]OCG31456.1 hypothetical protein A9G45_01425 [Gilliamella apicola]